MHSEPFSPLRSIFISKNILTIELYFCFAFFHYILTCIYITYINIVIYLMMLFYWHAEIQIKKSERLSYERC